MTGTPRIGAARIVTGTSGLYTSHPDGEWAALMPVMGFTLKPVGFDVERRLVWDDVYSLVDLVAWHLDTPGRWWLRRGTETPILGVRDLRIAAELSYPIALYETPEGWALAHGDGVCVVNWGAPLHDLFAGVGHVECESPALRERFTKALRQWEPRIIGRSGRRAA